MKSVLIALFYAMLSTGCLGATATQSPGPADAPSGPWREQTHWVPVRDDNGSTVLLFARICRPQQDTPARVVIINHGNPPNPRDRSGIRLSRCDGEAMKWFLARGYMVVEGLRRGYGESGGAWAEGYSGACTAEEYAHAAREGGHDIDALIAYATSLPYARPDGVVVVGQSAGGWATDGYSSLPHPKVTALVSMAGGRGGHVSNQPNRNCRPDELARAAGLLGRTASTPMLWIFTKNDTYFAPDIAVAMHAAYTHSGAKAELIQLGPFAADGHTLFFGSGGSAIWGPLIERYLASRQAGP